MTILGMRDSLRDFCIYLYTDIGLQIQSYLLLGSRLEWGLGRRASGRKWSHLYSTLATPIPLFFLLIFSASFFLFLYLSSPLPLLSILLCMPYQFLPLPCPTLCSFVFLPFFLHLSSHFVSFSPNILSLMSPKHLNYITCNIQLYLLNEFDAPQSQVLEWQVEHIVQFFLK